MAQAGVLLPAGPLFMVDRGWSLSNSKKGTRKNPLDQNAGDNIKIYQATRPAAQKFQTASSVKAKGSNRFQFIIANGPDGRHDKNARKVVRRQARQHVVHTKTIVVKSKDGSLPTGHLPQVPEDVENESAESLSGSEHGVQVLAVVPKSSSPLYGNDHARDPTGLESYIHYYRNVIAIHAYPLGNCLNFEFNPIRGTCFPLAMNDRLFLQTIILISTIHQSLVNSTAETKLASSLARRVFRELRDRIARKDVSDATLLAVSCLALIEHTCGHHDKWKVHAIGMSEMLRLRGGIDSVDISIKWKIYRADLVGAVDQVSKPMLPHPGIRINLNDLALTSDKPLEKFVMAFTNGGMSNALQHIFRHIHYATEVVKRAIANGTALSAYFYDNSWMQIQHDLLGTTTSNPLDESWRIAGLIFANTFIKSRPFLSANCIVVSQKMRSSFGQALRMVTNRHHYLWLAYMGGLLSSETIDHSWFLQKLVPIVQECGCTTWTQTKEALEAVLWLDNLHDQAGFKLWEEVSIAISQISYSSG